jgi:hypothetical protein
MQKPSSLRLALAGAKRDIDGLGAQGLEKFLRTFQALVYTSKMVAISIESKKLASSNFLPKTM